MVAEGQRQGGGVVGRRVKIDIAGDDDRQTAVFQTDGQLRVRLPDLAGVYGPGIDQRA